LITGRIVDQRSIWRGSARSKIFSNLLRALNDCCVLKSSESMNKNLVLIATVSLVLGACERHPASQLPAEGEGAAKEQPEKTSETAEKPAAPQASPSGTPKTYFPQKNS
jgi:hypothetical protein